MENRPLKRQIQSTFVKILLSAVAATILTYAFAAIVYMNLQYITVYPSNYYERQIPQIEEYIQKESTALLSPSSQKGLEQVIPERGIGYQVLDGEGRVLYGTMNSVFIDSKEQLYRKLNTLERHDRHYVKTIPVLDETDGKLCGAVILSYQLKLSYAGGSGSFWLSLLFAFTLASPFLYIILFTLVFSRKFSKTINYPLTLLKNAAEKIKGKDLDFDIDYHAKNELGDLCVVFSEMKEELAKSLSAQWEMEQDRLEMVESLAHDLKTPLSVIAGYSEVLLELPIGRDEKAGRYLNVIRENAGKSVKLVRQMQYSSDLDENDVPLCLTPVKNTEFMKQKMRDYELQAKQKEIRLTLGMEGETRRTVLMDADKVGRILDNLISNSLQYTPAGGEIHIEVRAEQSRISYRISDTGKGFSPADLEHAFKKFYRGDLARTQEDGHSGLGLSISKQLAAKLGGSIRIFNTRTGGACVEFSHQVYEPENTKETN